MGSNPTPRALFVDSTVSFMTRKTPTSYHVVVKKAIQDTQTINRSKDEPDTIISKITLYQKRFISKILRQMACDENENATILCDYIIAEQSEFNIKESTKEGKIKCLVRLSKFLKGKSYRNMIKQDILQFLNSLKKPEPNDPHHRSIGTYNGRQMIVSKFFRWLYSPDESDYRKRE